MKKVVFLLTALLLIGGGAFAQKKNVSKAKLKLQLDPPDVNSAKEAILPALKDSTTKGLAGTWFVAGEVFNEIILQQQKIENSDPKRVDRAIKISAAENALKYYMIADSMDQLPNKKGKIKPKYKKTIVERIKGLQPYFTEAASYYYDQKNFVKALESFETYMNYSKIPAMQGLGLEKDSLMNRIIYFAGLSASNANMPKVADKYFEIVKDIEDPRVIEDPKSIYAQLSNDYMNLKDTVNMLRILKLGVQKFPEESYYVRNLINYYINEEKLGEARIWVNQALVKDIKNAVLWNLKGRMIENDSIEAAKLCYQKAIELDPSFPDPLGNLGRIYYNFAVDELNRVNAIREDKKYRAEKAKLKPLFEKPLPYFEKAYSLNPGERDYVTALRGIYYNIGQEAKYKEMDARYNDM